MKRGDSKMKKRMMRSMILLVVLAIFLGGMTSYAEKPLKIEVQDIQALPGQSVSIPLVVSQNPGICYLSMTLSYDEALGAPKASNGKILDGFTSGKNLIWDAASNSAKTGTLVTVVFDLPEGIRGGQYTVKFIVRECYDEDLKDISVEAPSFTISVKGQNVKGDINSDGACDISDVTTLLEYLSTSMGLAPKDEMDLNKDGLSTIADVTILLSYLSGNKDAIQN